MIQLSSPLPPTSGQAKRLASELIRRHAADSDFSVLHVLEAYPELRSNKSAVLDLICEEVSRRISRAEPIDVQSFADSFPEYRSAVIDHIEVYQALADSLEIKQPRWPSEGDEFLGYSLVEEIGR